MLKSGYDEKHQCRVSTTNPDVAVVTTFWISNPVTRQQTTTSSCGLSQISIFVIKVFIVFLSTKMYINLAQDSWLMIQPVNFLSLWRQCRMASSQSMPVAIGNHTNSHTWTQVFFQASSYVGSNTEWKAVLTTMLVTIGNCTNNASSCTWTSLGPI